MDDLGSAEEDFGEELQSWESSRLAILSWLHCLLAIALASSLVSKPLLPEDGVVKVSYAAEQGGRISSSNLASSSLKAHSFHLSILVLGPQGSGEGVRGVGGEELGQFLITLSV